MFGVRFAGELEKWESVNAMGVEKCLRHCNVKKDQEGATRVFHKKGSTVKLTHEKV